MNRTVRKVNIVKVTISWWNEWNHIRNFFNNKYCRRSNGRNICVGLNVKKDKSTKIIIVSPKLVVIHHKLLKKCREQKCAILIPKWALQNVFLSTFKGLGNHRYNQQTTENFSGAIIYLIYVNDSQKCMLFKFEGAKI